MIQNLFLILILFASSTSSIEYPVRFTYVNAVASWSSYRNILSGMGVPGYAAKHNYNYIALAFWSYPNLLDMVKLWDDPVKYLGSRTELG